MCKQELCYFLYGGECWYSMYFYLSKTPIYTQISYLPWYEMQYIILLDKHDVANHTVLKLTATLCQVWWYIALTTFFFLQC